LNNFRTRKSKRNAKTADFIDEDMLPPSNSDTGESDASDEEEESVYNPNRRV
jgi:hypothetical protein